MAPLCNINPSKRGRRLFLMSWASDRSLQKSLSSFKRTKSTLFAPTNEAFDSVSDGDYPTRDVLMYHISDHVFNTSTLRSRAIIKSLYESPGLNYSPQLLRISLEPPCIPSTSTVRNSFWRVEPEICITGTDEVNTEAGESLYVNRAKVVIPDLRAQSGGVVHGVSQIIWPPGETILDEIERHSAHFSYLNKAWSETGVDEKVRDGKDMTLFAAHDKAWKALPKKLLKWLFSNDGREHLKIFSMYQVANRAVYTPEIFNKTRKDGTPDDDYHEIILQSLLNSPWFELHVLAKPRKSVPAHSNSESELELYPKNLADLIETIKGLVQGDEDPKNPDDDKQLGHHHRYRNPNHSHHHPHRGSKRHRHRHHHHRHHHHSGSHDGGGCKKPKLPTPTPTPRRDEIFVNKKARVLHGFENWIAGNGVVHVVDRVLMPPRSKGCERMTAAECAAWETMWDLANVGVENVVDDTIAWWEDLTLFDVEDGEDKEGLEKGFFDLENDMDDEELDAKKDR
ncbi:hypothetical protein BGZ54_008047 [Gamsiella multidivaricata]|nr:hypothetical protein BGZ54_008047 [Gamsiella multidivaricata]